jgi:L-alanine-DL-glutamate epimerase-like enolase superfamily enzyme
VREHCSIPIMADESVSSLNDAQMLIEHEAVDLFNIKLMKCGGIVNSAKIMSLAESAKIKCMIGCMCESRIGITAAIHLASALSNVQYADLDSDLLIKERVTLSGADIHGSRRTPPSDPGLGISELDSRILGKPLKEYTFL